MKLGWTHILKITSLSMQIICWAGHDIERMGRYGGTGHFLIVREIGQEKWNNSCDKRTWFSPQGSKQRCAITEIWFGSLLQWVCENISPRQWDIPGTDDSISIMWATPMKSRARSCEIALSTWVCRLNVVSCATNSVCTREYSLSTDLWNIGM